MFTYYIVTNKDAYLSAIPPKMKISFMKLAPPKLPLDKTSPKTKTVFSKKLKLSEPNVITAK